MVVGFSAEMEPRQIRRKRRIIESEEEESSIRGMMMAWTGRFSLVTSFTTWISQTFLMYSIYYHW